MEQSRKKHFTFRMTNDEHPIMISNNNPQKKEEHTQSRKNLHASWGTLTEKKSHGEESLIQQ